MRDTTFRVFPLNSGKMSYFKSLREIVKTYTSRELRGAHISVIFSGVVVGDVDPYHLIREAR